MFLQRGRSRNGHKCPRRGHPRMMSTQGLYVLAEDVPAADVLGKVLGGDVLGKDMVSQQEHPSNDIMSSTDMSLTGTFLSTSLMGTWCPHREILARTLYLCRGPLRRGSPRPPSRDIMSSACMSSARTSFEGHHVPMRTLCPQRGRPH